jgi:hypothetical protein
VAAPRSATCAETPKYFFSEEGRVQSWSRVPTQLVRVAPQFLIERYVCLQLIRHRAPRSKASTTWIWRTRAESILVGDGALLDGSALKNVCMCFVVHSVYKVSGIKASLRALAQRTKSVS